MFILRKAQKLVCAQIQAQKIALHARINYRAPGLVSHQTQSPGACSIQAAQIN